MCFSIPGTTTSASCSRPTLHMLWGSTTAKRTRPFPSRQYRLPDKTYEDTLCFVFLWLSFVTTFVWQLFSVCTFRSENIIMYDDTPRISFYIAVTNPASHSVYISRDVVEAAIRWASFNTQVYFDYIQNTECNILVLFYPRCFIDFINSCNSRTNKMYF